MADTVEDLEASRKRKVPTLDAASTPDSKAGPKKDTPDHNKSGDEKPYKYDYDKILAKHDEIVKPNALQKTFRAIIRGIDNIGEGIYRLMEAIPIVRNVARVMRKVENFFDKILDKVFDVIGLNKVILGIDSKVMEQVAKTDREEFEKARTQKSPQKGAGVATTPTTFKDVVPPGVAESRAADAINNPGPVAKSLESQSKSSLETVPAK